jgi:Mn2+/Fe2+ NRAMP family transporter
MALLSGLFSKSNRFMGAAFLMATAAIGPGFITQTTVFTGQLFTSFGFAILVSILIDMVVQLNIWRITGASGKRAPELLNNALPGMGTGLVFLIAAGGLIFNIGNIGGCSLALQSLFGLPFAVGAMLSCGLAIILFLVKEFGKAMDNFTKTLGLLMIGLMGFVTIKAHPPVADMLLHSIVPEKIDVVVIITLVGGTVGGYISFAGAHRMLDAGITGQAHIKDIQQGAITGILLAGIMRILLFAAVAGVVATGVNLPQENPASKIFEVAAGPTGKVIFGIILWCAAITSVVAAAYTSVSFIGSASGAVKKHERKVIIMFMLVSTLIFMLIGSPTKMLVKAGTLNGLVLPLALAGILWVVKKNGIRNFQHPKWLLYTGWLVTSILIIMAIRSVWVMW